MFERNHPGSVVPDDIMKAVEHRAVELIREEAAHRFESDGFEMETCEDAVEALEREGFRESFWYTSPDVVDDVREWYEDRTTVERPATVDDLASVMVANRSVVQAPDGVVDDSMYLIAEEAVAEPPVFVPHTPIVIRHPSGVAVVDL